MSKIQKKSVPKAPFTRLTLPFQCDLRLSAAKRNGITHAAAARSNLDAAISLRSADTELQNTIELCTAAHKLLRFCSSKTGISTPKRKNDDFEALLKRNFKRKIIGAKIQKRVFPKHLSHVSRCHYNAIYDSQLQNAIVFRMQLPQGATLTQPFHCHLQTLNCKTQAFVRGVLQIPKVENVETKLLREASFKFQ